MRPELGRYGVWANRERLNPEVAADLEAQGFGTIWVGSTPPGDLTLPQSLLAATSRITVATGIVNIWKDDARTVAAAYRRVEAAHPGRFLLGIGAGHPEATAEYRTPYDALVAYLDVLDAEGVPSDRRVLAALGPRVLSLSAARSAGAHPYLVPPEHTRRARAILGRAALLVPEQHAVVDPDPERARSVARQAIGGYLRLTNYVSSFRRLGFTETDLADGGSDRIVDALVAHGDPSAVAARVNEHLSAGADQVAIQVLARPDQEALEDLRLIAAELGLPAAS